MSAIQLAAGCPDVPSTHILRSRPLGMLLHSASVLHASRTAEIMRRAASPSVGGDAVPEGGMDNKAAAAGSAEACTGGSPAGGLGSRPPDGGLTPARGVRAAHERFAKSLSAGGRALTRDAAPHPGPAGAPTPKAAPGTGKDKPGARRR